MKKNIYILLFIILIIIVTGCTKVAKGNYKEGTYFGYDSENKYTAVIYVGSDGMIKSVFIDAAYGKENEEKEIISTTKQILGDDYNMKRVSKIGNEWYEQVKLIADKVVEEQGINWLEFKYRTEDESGNYIFVSDKPEGVNEGDKKYTDSISGVTIHVNESYTAILNALEKAKK